MDVTQGANACSTIEYVVKVERCAYPPHFSGQYAMQVGPQSLVLTSLKPGAQAVPFEYPWSQVGELTEKLLSNGTFSMELGDGGAPCPVSLRLVKGNAHALRRLFDSLPAEVWLAKCPKCSGKVVDDVCRGCGINRRLALRKGGVTLVAYGAGVLVLSVGLAIFGAWLLGDSTVIAIGGLALGFLLIGLGLRDLFISLRPSPAKQRQQG